MDTNGPGTSLFQGNDLNNFHNLDSREEEEEDLEEQRRRELELKNELENAFDDVSLDNDDESLCNGSESRSGSAHSSVENNLPLMESYFYKDSEQNRPIKRSISPNHSMGGFNSPTKHSLKTNSVKKLDINNDGENITDDCRKKIHNGTLHDIVDQSGGGDQNMQSILHYNHCFKRSPLGDILCNGLQNNSDMKNSNFTGKAEDSSEQLKILYDVRVREVHRLTELIDSMRNEHEIEVNDLKHQLALMVAERERANISHSQLQSLLVDCKQQVEHLLHDVKTLENSKKELEASNKELMVEFDTAKLTIDDLQRKILILEKGNKSKSETEQLELNLKHITEKHSMELINVQKELDTYVRNYENLFKENEELKLKIINLSQINDENLAKKSEIISRLSQQIEDTQKQFENLMKLSTTEDNFKLQAELKILKEEKLQLILKIEALEKEKLRQDDELKQYECLNKMSFLSPNSNCDFKDLEGFEISGKLGAELYKALNSQKAKRLEIKNLEAQLEEKNKKILYLMENESKLKSELAKLKEEINLYSLKLKDCEKLISDKEEEKKEYKNKIEELQQNIQSYKCDSSDKCKKLEEENKIFENKILALEKENEEKMKHYNAEYLRFHNEGLEKIRDETENYYKLELLKKDLENESLKKEIEEIKNLYIDMCNLKECSLSKDPGRSSSGSPDVDVKKLQKQLDKSRHRILELDQTLKQQYEQEVDILNLEINQLKLQLEKLKKERDRDVAERDKILVENELLKTEIEQVTSEKNLFFLNYEKLVKEKQELCESLETLRESSKSELKKALDRHSAELQSLSNKYEMTIRKMKREIELAVAKSVSQESKSSSPMKNSSAQKYSLEFVDKCSSPISNILPQDTKSPNETATRVVKHTSVLTDPEPIRIPKKEVIEIMKKLGAHHEEEMSLLEKKYASELMKLEKKFHSEVDSTKEIIRRELQKQHQLELEEMEEKHRKEMENRIEQEKKEVVVDLITEWACEVQDLKMSYAESQAETEKMKMKYKAAKSLALQYKTYFKNKAVYMKEEWKRIEDGYERALKELEKNVHILVDVKEDEVKSKVDSITKLYEQKINKMKEKLLKCENKLKAEKEGSCKKKDSPKSLGSAKFEKDLEKLSVPDGSLNEKLRLLQSKRTNDILSQCKKLLDEKEKKEESGIYLKQEEESGSQSKTPKKKVSKSSITLRKETISR